MSRKYQDYEQVWEIQEQNLTVWMDLPSWLTTGSVMQLLLPALMENRVSLWR